MKVSYLDKSVELIVKNKTEHIQKHWLAGQFYETQRNGMLNYIHQNFKGGVLVDVGACIGNHTLFFDKICGGKVIAFEPVESNFNHLKENCKANKSTARLVKCALGEKRGKVSMKSMSRANIGMYQVQEGNDTILSTLDYELRNESRVDMIKIDVEHYNIPLLKGAKKVLTTLNPSVFIECETQEILQTTDKMMVSYGYKKVENLVFNHTPTYLWLPQE